MSKKVNKSEFAKKADHGPFQVYLHKKNGLHLIHYPIAGSGVITANITYKVGSVDEPRGESGLAHMLEHMLFKPTKQDLAKSIELGSAMQFERDTGAVLNANTSYDRTTYYFSFPKKYLQTVMQLEANRMQDVALSDKEFLPERGNVLSEFDMYNGDPYFALEVAMRCSTFQSHAYDHEVIGFREDIEDYTVEKLQRFYEMYYQPNNATLMLIGDITKQDALSAAQKHFGTKKNPVPQIHREVAREPKITGPRTVTIKRPGTTNILSLGFIHSAFPSENWFLADIALRVLAGGPESILHTTLVDTGLVSSLDHFVWSSAQPNMGLLFVRLADGVTHEKVEELVHETISNIDTKTIAALIRSEKTKLMTQEALERVSSLSIASELTQYVASDSLESYTQTEELVQPITPHKVVKVLHEFFNKDTLTTGYYKSI